MARLRVLIAGGGVAALETALALRALAEERVEIRLVAAEPVFRYRPLAVLEPFGGAPVPPLELRELADVCGAELEVSALARVDPSAHVVWTSAGAEHRYDVLVLALGARAREALPGALTFRGSADADALRRLVEGIDPAASFRLVFAVPGPVAWALPLYELALLTSLRLEERRAFGAELALVTHEQAPLAVLGTEPSASVAALFGRRGIALHTGRYTREVTPSGLALAPRGLVPADGVVALPRLEGVDVGVPHDRDGFLRTDSGGRVLGVPDVYAAGDVTAFPIKQGGLAAQQADAVAESIAARSGVALTPQPFRPVVRGLLLTGVAPLHLRASVAGGVGDDAEAAADPLWWPPAKIAGRYLAPFLAGRADEFRVAAES